jgi:hypothetical protein
MVTFRKVGTDTYVASPLSKKADALLQELQREGHSAPGYLFVYGIPACIFVLGLIWTIGIANTFYYSSDVSTIGMLLTIADIIVAAAAWFGALILYIRILYRRLRYYKRRGEITDIPSSLRYRIDEALKEDGTTEFVTKAYVLSIVDYTDLRQMAEAYNTGVVTTEMEESHIKPLLRQFRGRVLTAYQSAQADQKGRLEGRPGGEIEG